MCACLVCPLQATIFADAAPTFTDVDDPFEEEDISEDEMSFDIGSDADDDF